jgi:hypothetical protein
MDSKDIAAMEEGKAGSEKAVTRVNTSKPATPAKLSFNFSLDSGEIQQLLRRRTPSKMCPRQ